VFPVGHCADKAVRASSAVLFVTETDCVYRAVRTVRLIYVFQWLAAIISNVTLKARLPSLSFSFRLRSTACRCITGTHTHGVLQEAYLSVCCVGMSVSSCCSPHKLLQKNVRVSLSFLLKLCNQFVIQIFYPQSNINSLLC
jgi:hypothetical protein